MHEWTELKAAVNCVFSTLKTLEFKSRRTQLFALTGEVLVVVPRDVQAGGSPTHKGPNSPPPHSSPEAGGLKHPLPKS